MFCSNCGCENRDESKFCSGCGRPITKNKVEEKPKVEVLDDNHIENEVETTSSDKRKLLIGLGITAGVIVACVAGYFGVMSTMKPVEIPGRPQIQGSSEGNKPSYSKENSNKSVDLDSKNKSDGYIAKDSSIKLLTKEELEGISSGDLALIRNEIYARHGYVFKSEEYANYFSSKGWYTENPSFSGNESDLNQVERDNVALIKSLEGR